eukprot:scaffold1162_cov170-Amphora_coffeaeformis.AAC.15
MTNFQHKARLAREHDGRQHCRIVIKTAATLQYHHHQQQEGSADEGAKAAVALEDLLDRMASFINHKTNLSAFNSQLQSICDQIAPPKNAEFSDEATATTTTAQHHRRQDALNFLKDQKTRIVQVERSLLRLTHNVLPDDDDSSMSMTELSRTIYELQRHYIRRLAAIQRKLEPQQPQQEEQQQCEEEKKAPQHWSVGRILTAVPETDRETDSSVATTGKSTASSTFFKSPAYPSSAKKSPWTPGSRKTRIIAETIDESDDEFGEQQATYHQELMSASETLLLSPATPTSPRLSRSTQSILNTNHHHDDHGDDNDDDDDEVNQTRTSGQRRVDVFAELEQRRHQILHENDDDDALKNDESIMSGGGEEETVETMTPTVVAARPQNFTSPSNASVDQTWDDSARYCPTVVHTKTPRSVARRHLGPRPSHIEFEPRSMASPAMSSVNMTMDNEELDETMNELTTYLDEAMAGLEPVQERGEEEDVSSQISTETPVLDRYRLDIDEKVPGGFVVRPNPRHRHRKAVKLPPFPQRKSPPEKQQSFVSKTAPFIDENTPLNLATTDNNNRTKSTLRYDQSSQQLPRNPLATQTTPKESFSRRETSVRTNTPGSHRTSPGTEHTRDAYFRANSTRLPESSERPGHVDTGSNADDASPRASIDDRSSRTPLAADSSSQLGSSLSQKSTFYRDTPSSKAIRPTRLHQSLSGAYSQGDEGESPGYESNRRATFQTLRSPTTNLSQSPQSPAVKARNTSPRKLFQIVPISREEYEASPRIVTMQVSLAQVHEAVILLNQAWKEDPHLSSPLTENQIARVWGAHTTDRQRTRLLLSLCHWRRLESRPAGEDSPHHTVYHVVLPKTSM